MNFKINNIKAPLKINNIKAPLKINKLKRLTACRPL